jgi:hypothetical protein
MHLTLESAPSSVGLVEVNWPIAHEPSMPAEAALYEAQHHQQAAG